MKPKESSATNPIPSGPNCTGWPPCRIRRQSAQEESPLKSVSPGSTALAAATDSELSLSLFREPRKLAKGSNTVSSKAATHNACRCEEGPRRNARERSTVTAAMMHVIQRAFVTSVTQIYSIGFFGFSLLAALVLLYQTAQLLKFCGIELLVLDEAHEETVHRTAKESINHVPDCVACCLLSGQHWCVVVRPAPQSSPSPPFPFKHVQHRLHGGVCQSRRSGKFLLDRLDVGRTAVP